MSLISSVEFRAEIISTTARTEIALNLARDPGLSSDNPCLIPSFEQRIAAAEDGFQLATIRPGEYVEPPLQGRGDV
jgi:hypothetical protein